MELQLVSPETAQLLKQVGFDIETEKIWYDSYHYPEGMIHNKAKLFWKDTLHFTYEQFPEYQFPAPTQELVNKWLRDIHKIFINIQHKPFNQKFGYQITTKYQDGEFGVISPYNFKTLESHEQCLEIALIE